MYLYQFCTLLYYRFAVGGGGRRKWHKPCEKEWGKLSRDCVHFSVNCYQRNRRDFVSASDKQRLAANMKRSKRQVFCAPDTADLTESADDSLFKQIIIQILIIPRSQHVFATCCVVWLVSKYSTHIRFSFQVSVQTSSVVVRFGGHVCLNPPLTLTFDRLTLKRYASSIWGGEPSFQIWTR